MQIIEVLSRKDNKDFLKVPKLIYKNDPFWVSPLDKDIKIQFNPKRNRFFDDGEAKRWLAKSSKGKLIGRIAAFYNHEKAAAEKILTGGIGFFECIDDIKAAHALFDAAADWLASKGMRAMDGPINFGENDSDWGLLVDGFMPQAFGMPYHLPYYKNLFESYGFQIFFRQFSYHLNLSEKFPERFWKIAEWVSKKEEYTFRHFEWKEARKFIRDTVSIYNKAWAAFKEDYTPLREEVLYESMMKAKPIIDPELVWFAYHNNEPVAFFIILPDANQILKRMHGKMHIFNMLRFLWLKRNKTITRVRAQAAGVVPSCQNHGLESGIFWHLNEKMKQKTWYKEVELSWVGDFNPKMIAIYKAVGAKKAKTHHTYRYMIDKTVPFERFMPENVKEEDE